MEYFALGFHEGGRREVLDIAVVLLVLILAAGIWSARVLAARGAGEQTDSLAQRRTPPNEDRRDGGHDRGGAP